MSVPKRTFTGVLLFATDREQPWTCCFSEPFELDDEGEEKVTFPQTKCEEKCNSYKEFRRHIRTVHKIESVSFNTSKHNRHIVIVGKPRQRHWCPFAHVSTGANAATAYVFGAGDVASDKIPTPHTYHNHISKCVDRMTRSKLCEKTADGNNPNPDTTSPSSELASMDEDTEESIQCDQYYFYFSTQPDQIQLVEPDQRAMEVEDTANLGSNNKVKVDSQPRTTNASSGRIPKQVYKQVYKFAYESLKLAEDDEGHYIFYSNLCMLLLISIDGGIFQFNKLDSIDIAKINAYFFTRGIEALQYHMSWPMFCYSLEDAVSTSWNGRKMWENTEVLDKIKVQTEMEYKAWIKAKVKDFHMLLRMDFDQLPDRFEHASDQYDQETVEDLIGGKLDHLFVD